MLVLLTLSSTAPAAFLASVGLISESAAVKVFLASFALTPMFVLVRLAARWRARPLPSDAALLEDISGMDQHLVELRIYQLTYVGSDRGVVWIENGALHFCGHASSFILGSQDFEIPKAAEPTRIHLQLKGPVPTSWIEVIPILSPHCQPSVLVETLRFFVAQFQPTELPRQWPPFTKQSSSN